MRKTKVKEIRKSFVLTCAVVLMAVGSAAFADAWTDFKGLSNTNPGNMTLSGNATATDTLSLPTVPPPVPNVFTMNGGNQTITTGAGLTNSVITTGTDTTTTVNINNINFTGTGVATETNGAAISNSANMSITGSASNKATFSGHVAKGNGGAIENTGNLTINNVYFGGANSSDGNKTVNNGGTSGFGGAIDSNSSTGSLVISNSTFNHNEADGFGGAVSNRAGEVTITDSIFDNNAATAASGTTAGQGGAILNGATMTINTSSFNNNTAGNNGGAISNALTVDGSIVDTGSHLFINNSNFVGNSANNFGGAIYNTGSRDSSVVHELSVTGGTFQNNKVTAANSYGGAIDNGGATSAGGSIGIANINGVTFQSNTAVSAGGAVSNAGNMQITNAKFIQNGTYDGTTVNNGGAIRNFQATDTLAGSSTTNLIIKNTEFTENVAENRGGAIYNISNSTTNKKAVASIIDSTMIGNVTNTATDVSGGAIFGGANSVTNIIATRGNKTIIGAERMTIDAPVPANASTDTISFIGSAEANFNAITDGVVEINSTVTGDRTNGNVININKAITVDGVSGTYDGTVHFKGYGGTINNSDIHLYNGELQFDHDRSLSNTNALTMHAGTLNLLNGELYGGQIFVDSLTLAGNSNIKLDVDLANKTMDQILIGNNAAGTKTVNTISNPGNSTLNVSAMKSISEAADRSTRILFTDAPELIGHVSANGASIVEGPISKYAVTQDTVNMPSIGGTPNPDNGEYFIFNRIGDSDPIVAGPVAAQAAFLLMDNLYRQSFANMDMVTLMSPEQRMAWKMRNKYASAGYHRGVYAPNVVPEERDGWYLRPFTNFENVPLKNGPRVSNVSYGTLIGGESDIIDLGHGWDGNFSLFGAYHGSHQAYNGVSIYQNGGTFGGVATAYKGNFFTGLTANIGASAARATHMFGSEDMPILMTGAAWKSGYNFNMFDSKLILQPSYMMSYTFVNVFDYTNSAGVHVTQDPLHAIEIIPGLRLIGNLKNGWQPYLGVNMTWNLMDRTKFYANEVALTQLSVKPYVEYGVGLQKRTGDRFTGFGQAMFRNGGRNGVAFTLGFRWALGH